MFKAILWDNDGVLVDTERLYYQASKKVLAEEGIELDEEIYCQVSLSQSGGVFVYAVAHGLQKEKVDDLRKRRNDLYNSLLKSEDFSIFGVEEVLSSLMDRYLMGVVTSSRREHFETIHSRTSFLNYFDLVLVREEYQNSKPDPEPYLLAAEKIAIKPEDCLIIEDSPRGLQAGLAAGMTVWVIPNRFAAKADFSAAEKTLSSISEVADLL